MANDISNVSAGFSRAGHFNIDNVTDERIRNGNLTIGEARTIAAKVLGLPTWAISLYPPKTKRKALRRTESNASLKSLRKKWQDMHYPCQQDLSVIG